MLRKNLAEKLLDAASHMHTSSGRILRISGEAAPDEVPIAMDFAKLAIDFQRFADKNPGQAFNAMVEDWGYTRINRELY